MTPVLLLLIVISSSIVSHSFVIKPKSNVHVHDIKATNTNRDDISDK